MNNNKVSNIKGKDLEEATEKIITHIINVNPCLKNSTFSIEKNKIIYPGGTKKEIDLFVKVDPGNDLSSIFIFECKNWKKAISVNEVTIFSQKIEDTGSTKGFLLAKKFSKYAVNEANKNDRLLLLNVKDTHIDYSCFPEAHSVYIDKGKYNIRVIIMQKNNDLSGKMIQINTDKVIFRKEELNARDFLLNLADNVMNEKLKYEQTQAMAEGVYNYSHEKMFSFRKGELTIDKYNVDAIKLILDFIVYIIKPIIVSTYEIENKGRYLKQIYILPNNGMLSAEFVKSI